MGETDTELLELAAKAAGIEHGADRLGCGLSLTEPDGRHRSLPRWNPLEDDGDALRLRNAMQMTIVDEGDKVFAEVARYPVGGAAREPYERDLPGGFASQTSVDSAVRRAIVRAAAATARHTEGP